MALPVERTLGQDLLAFGVASVTAQLVSAATTPIYTRVLGPSEFGVLETAMAVISFGMTLFALGFDQAVVVQVAQTADRRKQGPVLGSAVALPTAAATVVGLIVVAGALLLGGGGALICTAIGLPFLLSSYLSQQGLRSLDLVRPFVWSVALRSLVATLLSCALIFTISPNATGVLAGLVIGAALATLTNVIALNRSVPMAVTAPSTRELLRFGLPLLPSALAGWSSMLVDRLVLASKVSFQEVGIYGVATRISGLLLTLLFGFQTAWTARAVKDFHHDPATEPRRRSEALLLLCVGIGFGGTTLCAFGPELVAILGGSQYADAAYVLPVLVLSNAVFAISAVAQVPALATGRTGTISWIALGSAALNLVLNLVLIPWFGIMGAAVSTLVAFLVFSGAMLLVSRGIRRAALPIGRVAAIWAALAPIAFLGFVPVSLLLFVAKVVLLASAAVALHRLRLFTVDEARRILLGQRGE